MPPAVLLLKDSKMYLTFTFPKKKYLNNLDNIAKTKINTVDFDTSELPVWDR